MNTTVMSKLMKAKKLEYEALKELMPTAVREHMELSEKQMKDFVKTSGYQIYREFTMESGCMDEEKQGSKSNSSERHKSVTID